MRPLKPTYRVICNCLIDNNINKISLPAETSREILFNQFLIKKLQITHAGAVPDLG